MNPWTGSSPTKILCTTINSVGEFSFFVFRVFCFGDEAFEFFDLALAASTKSDFICWRVVFFLTFPEMFCGEFLLLAEASYINTCSASSSNVLHPKVPILI